MSLRAKLLIAFMVSLTLMGGIFYVLWSGQNPDAGEPPIAAPPGEAPEPVEAAEPE